MKWRNKMEQGRGQLTQRIKDKSKELFGYEISQVELRLLPYLQYTMVNDQKLDIRLISSEERKILSKWRAKGYIEGGAGGMKISREFWDIMLEIIFLGYVDLS
jgi:hypothetical protein